MKSFVQYSLFLSLIAFSPKLWAWPGIVGELIADIEAVQDQIGNNGGDQPLSGCDNCHGNANGDINLSNNFTVEDSMGNPLALGSSGDAYIPGDVYTIRMRVFMPDNAEGKRFRGAYRILAFGNNTGTFSNVPADANGEGGNNLAHIVDSDDLVVDPALSVVDDNFWEVSFDWTAPEEGTTVQFNLFSMGSNGNGTAEDTDGIADKEGSISNTSNLTFLGPLSGTDADIPDLVDPGASDDDETAAADDEGETEATSSVQVTSFNGGCGATISANNNFGALILVFILGILLCLSRLRALTFLPRRPE